MRPMDSKWVKKAESDLVEFQVGQDPFTTFVPIDKLERFFKHIYTYRSGERHSRVRFWELSTTVDEITWTVGDSTMTVSDLVLLNYQMEYDSFTSNITSPTQPNAPVTLEQVKQAIQENSWREAKTSKQTNPHEYAVKRNWNSVTLSWYEMLRYIHQNAKVEYFWRRRYLVCEIDGMKYWSMGNAETITIILNRAVA